MKTEMDAFEEQFGITTWETFYLAVRLHEHIGNSLERIKPTNHEALDTLQYCSNALLCSIQYLGKDFGKDMLGYLEFMDEIKNNTKAQDGYISCTLLHDVMGGLNQDECFLPRIDGYKEHYHKTITQPYISKYMKGYCEKYKVTFMSEIGLKFWDSICLN